MRSECDWLNRKIGFVCNSMTTLSKRSRDKEFHRSVKSTNEGLKIQPRFNGLEQGKPSFPRSTLWGP
jgi:hypothetical protein